MTSLRDQFSAVGKAQFEAQFDFFTSMTTQALESAGRVVALNMAVSRDTVQRSLGATCALMNSRNPRDMLTVGGQAEEQMRSLFSYGRELLGIASGMRPHGVPPQMLSLTQASARIGEQMSETVEIAGRGLADAAVQAAPAADIVVEAPPETAAPHPVAAFAPVTEPVVVAEAAAAPEPEPQAALAEAVPASEPKPIAKAVGKGVARAATIPHPAAAQITTAADAAPAPKAVTPPAPSRRKK